MIKHFVAKLEGSKKSSPVTFSPTSFAFPSSSYTFHHTCGANVAVTCGDKKAKRIKYGEIFETSYFNLL